MGHPKDVSKERDIINIVFKVLWRGNGVEKQDMTNVKNLEFGPRWQQLSKLQG
jgi:hypothetical protein